MKTCLFALMLTFSYKVFSYDCDLDPRVANFLEMGKLASFVCAEGEGSFYYANGEYAGSRGSSWYHPNGEYAGSKESSWYHANGEYAGSEGSSWYHANGEYAGSKGSSWYHANGEYAGPLL